MTWQFDFSPKGGTFATIGIVPISTGVAKAAAEADALKVSGVKRVVNELQVVASAKQKAVNASDDELQHEVRKALDEHEFRDVGLEVRNGIVRLTGTVPIGARNLEAAVVARSIPGVRAVDDDLRLRQPSTNPNATAPRHHTHRRLVCTRDDSSERRVEVLSLRQIAGKEVTTMTFEETAKSTVFNAKDQGRETAEKAGQVVKDGYKAAQQGVEDELLNLGLGDFVRREPWLAIAAAFAIGYVAAQIIRRVS